MRMPALPKSKRIRITILVSTILLSCVFFTVNYNEPTQIGIARNMVSGEMWEQGGGLHIKPPWVWVVRIDTRPVRVGVLSGGRGYSGKLVQFDKQHWREFVAVEGWRYYWFSNRISFNMSYDEEYRGMKDILRGYAYGAKKYPFIVILQEYESK